MAQAVRSKVTVLMPVYNGEKYLQGAIASILNQTFTDFELLIINDGSTDNSVSIIKSFQDGRIRLVHNEKNIGIIETLNKGIGLAQGEYVARMDSDDISLPERLIKEVNILQGNENIAIVASHFIMIDEEGRNTGSWPPGIKVKSNEEIYKTLPRENCIAHPSVLIRTEIIRKYGYRKSQLGAEDWDLWLRMASDGIIFFKINEVLLKYRVHKASVTIVRNKSGEYINKGKVLIKYCGFKLRKLQFNAFDLRVMGSGVSNYFKHILSLITPNLPLFLSALFGRNIFKIWAQLFKVLFYNRGSDISLFLFTSSSKNGNNFNGLFEQKNGLIFITEVGENQITGNSNVINISAIASVPYISNLVKRILAKQIRKAGKPTVVGLDSSFFYHLLGYLDAETMRIDIVKENIDVNEYNDALIYNYGIWSIPYAERISKRIIVGKETFEEMKELYLSCNKGSGFLQRLEYVNDINEIDKIILHV